MTAYALNILGVSIIVSLATAALVYFALSRLLVRPMMRITRAMVRFREDPEDPARIVVPSSRHDEIGVAERELSEMQRQLSGAAAAEDAACPARARGEQDQPRPARHAGQRPAAVGPPDRHPRSHRAALRPQADCLARPGHQLLQRHAALWARRGGAAAARAVALEAAGRRGRRGARSAARGQPRLASSTWTTRCASTPTAIICSALSATSCATPSRRSKARPARRVERSASGPGATGAASSSRCATPGPACRKKRASTCSRPSPARSAKAEPGLGLAIAAEIIGVHGGHVRLLDTKRRAPLSSFEIPDRGCIRATTRRSRQCLPAATSEAIAVEGLAASSGRTG